MGHNLDDLFDACDAVGIGERVARGDVSAEEVTATGLARIARVDARLSAVSRLMAPGRSAPGPFSGVPFLAHFRCSA